MLRGDREKTTEKKRENLIGLWTSKTRQQPKDNNNHTTEGVDQKLSELLKGGGRTVEWHDAIKGGNGRETYMTDGP